MAFLNAAFSIDELKIPSADNLYQLMEKLFPIHRSLMGKGNRQTLSILNEIVNLQVTSIPSGTEVLDWTVPMEWDFSRAQLFSPTGKKVLDTQNNNLHVLQYSQPINRNLSLTELKNHLFTLPQYPNWIPYRTSYYKENWGFCLSHQQMTELEEGEYKAQIDCKFIEGSLDYAECVIPGKSKEEILITTHICHPSLCNDNLSGMSVSIYLAKYLSQFHPHYTYRFLFSPATLGPIAWLAKNEKNLGNIVGGFTLALLGSSGPLHYKVSRRGDTFGDQVWAHILKHTDPNSVLRPFSPYGYDERQFCSPGFNLPMGCLMRTPNGEFPEYHTSADNLHFIDKYNLEKSLLACLQYIEVLEKNALPINLFPKGEPQLGKRGLFKGLQGKPKLEKTDDMILWILNLGDSEHTLFDIAEKSGFFFKDIWEVSKVLETCGLIQLDPISLFSSQRRAFL